MSREELGAAPAELAPQSSLAPPTPVARLPRTGPLVLPPDALLSLAARTTTSDPATTGPDERAGPSRPTAPTAPGGTEPLAQSVSSTPTRPAHPTEPVEPVEPVEKVEKEDERSAAQEQEQEHDAACHDQRDRNQPDRNQPDRDQPDRNQPDRNQPDRDQPIESARVALVRRIFSPASTGRRLAWLLAAMAAGMGAGWLGAISWNSNPVAPPAPSGPVASAVVIDVQPAGGVPARTPVDLVVRISNLDRATLTLAGAEGTFDAGSIESVSPSGIAIPSGQSRLITVHAGVACGSPQPLRLAALQLRRVDRRLRTIQVTGAPDALARVCQLQQPGSQVLTLVSAAREGTRLKLAIRSPSGRTTQVLALGAEGVSLTGEPLPSSVEATARIIWLDPPASCPAEWVAAGLPRTVDLEVDVGGPATVSLDVGFAVAQWLRAGPCAGGPG